MPDDVSKTPDSSESTSSNTPADNPAVVEPKAEPDITVSSPDAGDKDSAPASNAPGLIIKPADNSTPAHADSKTEAPAADSTVSVTAPSDAAAPAGTTADGTPVLDPPPTLGTTVAPTDGSSTTPNVSSVPSPSAVVEPFVSGGGPPPSESLPKNNSGIFVMLGIAVVIILAAVVAFYVLHGMKNNKTSSSSIYGSVAVDNSSPSPSPSSSAVAGSLASSIQGINQSMSDLQTNLASTDTALADKQGNLSE
jgi:hypothetical protein